MELYYIAILGFIDKYHLTSKNLLSLLSPLGEKYPILGIPAQSKNLYRSIYRLEAAGYIHPVDAKSPEMGYTTTPRGQELLAEYLALQDSLVLCPQGNPSLSSSPSSSPIAKPDLDHPKPRSTLLDDVGEEQDTLDPVHEILVDYIPVKAHAKIASFYMWCQKTPKLTADTLHTKLITTFWGEDHLVPKSMAAKFPELIDRLLAII